jgi:uncharacterized protein (DUF697 family)
VLLPLQLGMLARINAVFGIEMSRERTAKLIKGLVGSGGTTLVGKQLAETLLKYVPAGAFVNAGVAAALTGALGEAYIQLSVEMLRRQAAGNPMPDVEMPRFLLEGYQRCSRARTPSRRSGHRPRTRTKSDAGASPDARDRAPGGHPNSCHILKVFRLLSYSARAPFWANPGPPRTTERTERVFHQAKKVLAGVVGLAALALGGSAIAGAATSSDAGTTTPSASSAQAPPAFSGPAHGTAAHEDAEKPVAGAAAAKAQAAAVKAVGSGTAGAVTTDMTGKGYETTVTKSDGSKVEVHLDSSYNVFGGRDRQGGPPPGGYGG